MGRSTWRAGREQHASFRGCLKHCAQFVSGERRYQYRLDRFTGRIRCSTGDISAGRRLRATCSWRFRCIDQPLRRHQSARQLACAAGRDVADRIHDGATFSAHLAGPQSASLRANARSQPRSNPPFRFNHQSGIPYLCNADARAIDRSRQIPSPRLDDGLDGVCLAAFGMRWTPERQR